MPIELLVCPACGGTLKFATHEPFNCPSCRQLQRLVDTTDSDMNTGYQSLEIITEELVEATAPREQAEIIKTSDTNKKEEQTVPENPFLSYISLVYPIFFFVTFGAWAIYQVPNTYQFFSIISYTYLFLFITSVSTSEIGRPASEMSTQTMISMLLWIIYNVIFFFTNLPWSLITQLPLIIILFILGALIGAIFNPKLTSETKELTADE